MWSSREKSLSNAHRIVTAVQPDFLLIVCIPTWGDLHFIVCCLDPPSTCKLQKRMTFLRYKWTYLQNRNRVTDVENLVIRCKACGGGYKLEDWDWHIPTTVQNRNLYSILCNGLYGKRILKRVYIWICITNSLCCTPETNTRLKSNILQYNF